jgi:outer membrane usher protein
MLLFQTTARLAAINSFILLSFITVVNTQAQQTRLDVSENRIVPFEVKVNGANSGTWILIERDGVLYAPRDAIDEWRILLAPDIQYIIFREEVFFPLAGIPGFDAKINFAAQSLELLFSPNAFAATRLTRQAIKKPVLSPVLPAAFLNYDLSYNAFKPASTASTTDLSALTEFGYSTGLGILTSSGIARNLTGDDTLGGERELKRMETTFTRDLPDRNRTLMIGDAYTKSGMLGRSIYFGGIQYGTNFSLAPGFVSQPLPTVSGLSATPSTVELYVNDVLRQVSSIPTGPFAMENFPTLTGGGDARVVVRDLLGRETVIEQSFFTSSQLLARGLNDWSVEAGSVRQDLGISNATYGPEFVSGAWRRGYSNAVTVEGRAELIADLTNLQAGALMALPFYTLGRATISRSRQQELGEGQQWLLGFDLQRLRSNLSIEFQGATENYRQLGQSLNTRPVKFQGAGNWSYSSDVWGSFGLGYAHLTQFASADVTTMSANYSKRIGNKASISFTASRAESEANSVNAFALSAVFQLSPNRVVSAYAGQRGSQTDLYTTISHSPGRDGNLGWRALAGQQQNNDRAEAGSYYTGRYGTVTGDISDSTQQSALRLGINGGMVLAERNLFVTRRVDSSFALAEIKGYSDIGIGIGGNMLTRTNSNGVALITNLMPYQNNSIRLDPRELPMSAEIDSIEQLAVPAYRSAVKISFPVRSGRGALISIELDDGDVAPAGAIAWIEGDDREFYVARRGQTFITGMQPQNQVQLRWKDQLCRFEVILPPEAEEEIARVGPLRCSGVAR